MSCRLPADTYVATGWPTGTTRSDETPTRPRTRGWISSKSSSKLSIATPRGSSAFGHWTTKIRSFLGQRTGQSRCGPCEPAHQPQPPGTNYQPDTQFLSTEGALFQNMYHYTVGNRSDYRNIFASLLNILRGIFFNISALTPYPPLDPSGLTPFTRNPSNSWNSFLPGATLPHVTPPPSMSGTHSSEQLYTSSLKRKCLDPSLVPRFLTVSKGRLF